MLQVDGLVEYSKTTIECMARDFLRRRVDVCTKEAPIDVELLLENTSNVTLTFASNLVNKYSVEGCVCNRLNTRELTVIVDQNIANSSDDARYNAVIAEELAHIELHKTFMYQVQSIDDFLAIQQHPKWAQIERDARQFSAAVRMPADLVIREAERAYPMLIDQHGFVGAQAVGKLLRNELAEVFVVRSEEVNGRLAEWPCNIYGRICASVESQSDSLLNLNANPVERKEKRPQGRLFR